MRDPKLEKAFRGVAPSEGVAATSVPGMVCTRFPGETGFSDRRWRACLAIVVEGTKQIVLGDTSYALSPGHYTLTPVPLPVESRIAEAPFVALLAELNAATLTSVVAEMDPREETPTGLQRGIFVGDVDAAMRDVVLRLATHCRSAEAGAVLGPGCVRELLFYILRGPNGPAVRQFVRRDSEAHRIAVAVHRIEETLERPLDIEALAAETGVSRSVFFEQFKRVTSLSPLQYQKRLRLLEAQRLMVEGELSAEGAGFRVGYQSPSQFSREYARMFGASPSRHAAQLRAGHASPV